MPQLRPGSPRRTVIVAVRLTPEEAADVERAARQERLPTTEFMRAVLLRATRRTLDTY